MTTQCSGPSQCLCNGPSELRADLWRTTIWRLAVVIILLTFRPMASRSQGTIPPGALFCGCTRLVINDKPNAKEVSPTGNGLYSWYSGEWYMSPKPAINLYKTEHGVLAIQLGGTLVSTPNTWSSGRLPLLSGAHSFYVEFRVWLSDNNGDHWPAVWLMPAEHNANRLADHYVSDPPGVEQWMELDVDEGGFGPGLTGTVHSWRWSPKRHYLNNQNPNNELVTPINRANSHWFGCSYNSKKATVTWWLDNRQQMSAGAPYVPHIATDQHFYLILDAASHGKNIPYTMYVSQVRAFVPPR